jgi:hypothetical protein
MIILKDQEMELENVLVSVIQSPIHFTINYLEN